MLALAWDRERSPSDLARRCGLSRPAASQHLRVLLDADLISVRSDGNRRWYRVRADRLADLRSMLDQFWGSKLDNRSTRMTLRNRGEPAGFSKEAAPVMSSAARRATTKNLRQLRQIMEARWPI